MDPAPHNWSIEPPPPPPPVKVKPILTLLLLIAFLPVIVIASRLRQSLESSAASPNTYPCPDSYSCPTPTPSSTRSISVTLPNGGETLYVGSTYRITWDSNRIDQVTLGYSSCPSCLSWIANNIANTGYYDWTVFVGNTANTQFKIYIVGYESGIGSISDYSDANFTILPKLPTPTPTTEPAPTLEPTPTPTPIPPASTIDIYAAGTSFLRTYPTMKLHINNKEVGTWTNVRGNANAGHFLKFTHISPSVLPPSTKLQVLFTNDAYLPRIGDRNLRIDKIVINGVDYQSESPATYDVGAKNSRNKCASGNLRTEWLLCNGYFLYTLP